VPEAKTILSGGGQQPAAQTTSTPASGGANEHAALIIGSVIAVFVMVFLLIFVRYKLRSHAISESYALYLSTLSYQRIRSLRAGAESPRTPA